MNIRSVLPAGLRTIAVIIALAVLALIWAPYGLTFYHYAALAPDGAKATKYEQFGYFDYYGKSTTYYGSGITTRTEKLDGFSLAGVTKSLLASIVVIGVMFAAVRPSSFARMARRLTMRWSGP